MGGRNQVVPGVMEGQVLGYSGTGGAQQEGEREGASGWQDKGARGGGQAI